ncbi:peptidase inhibitor family I36 protein [Streptomyces sp. NPDC018057]|uniref:peptidase inhibitor family I36 protein n=1 Tax=unclassified Streptomyces TaxID=2593676 RepID=UPI0037A13FA9
MKLRNKRLTGMCLTVLAAGVAVLGTTTAASASATNNPGQIGVWNVGSGCDAAKYEFCIYTDANYQGKSVGIRWGEKDNRIDLKVDIGASMYGSISSVKNNTNYVWALTADPRDSQVGLRVSSFHKLPNLADFGYDNKAGGLCIWKEAGSGS